MESNRTFIGTSPHCLAAIPQARVKLTYEPIYEPSSEAIFQIVTQLAVEILHGTEP
jgi:hypothetical protein